jgi:uncharacterized protein (DUF2141 family)
MKLGLVLALALALALGVAGSAVAQSGNTITVPVSGVRNTNGDVKCGLFNSAATWTKPGQEYKGFAAPIVGDKATCTFTDVPPGTYAVAVFHAQKGEMRMPTGLFGMPETGYGFSRDAKIGMGPPSFNSAAYAYPGGAASFPVTLTYP